MVPRTSYPPTVHHKNSTSTLSPSAAQTQLAAFLDKTSTSPHLHPDSLLSTTGITYSAHSGPSGGLAIHHLRRIEAGLRGENLIAETDEELAKFKDDDELKDGKGGDDARLDQQISQSQSKFQRKEGKKRKRTAEIQDWAEDTSSQADFPSQPGREIESFAHTPLHESDWQDQREYELQQQPLEGEVGERDAAGGARGSEEMPMGVLEHDGEGNVKKPLSEAEKRARNAAKKARKKAEKAAKYGG